jgi:uncharacterized membrane protein YphA (DoxX/SURF4 family)
MGFLSFIAALVYGVFNIVFNFIFPEFINEMISISKDDMLKKSNITSKDMEMR